MDVLADIQQEFKTHKLSFFVSLTYDEYSCPLQDTIDGVKYALRKEDWKKFIDALSVKILRRYQEKLVYYAIGEYGEKTGATHRPHFHFAFFTDNYQLSSEMKQLCQSIWVDKETVNHHICKKPRGRIDIERLDFGLMNYMTIDMMKSFDRSTCRKNFVEGEYVLDYCKRLNLEPPFHCKSRGFGDSYVTEEVKRYHRSDPDKNSFRILDSNYGPFKCRLSRRIKDKIYGKTKGNLLRICRTLTKRAEMFEQECDWERKEYGELYEQVERSGKGHLTPEQITDRLLRLYVERHDPERLEQVALGTDKARRRIKPTT